MNRKASTFYNQVVYGNGNLKTICDDELKQCIQSDFQELYANYNAELEEEFIAVDHVEDSKKYVRRYKLPKDRFKRVQIGMLILQTCADGIPFSEEVMASSIQYWNSLVTEE